jgi:AcrR family transcriptional regulator
MARKRHEAYRQEIASEIKQTARRQMAKYGTAGLTLRGIARELDITAPAIYHYFPSLDDLVTALVMDAFSELADAMQRAGEAQVGECVGPKLKAGLMAYRAFALQNPVDFQLIYGNPIPGYQAPFEKTAPLARKPFIWLGRLVEEGRQSGELKISEAYEQIPASIEQHLEGYRQMLGSQAPASLFYCLVVAWTRGHGMVMLELFNHSPAVIGDPAAFYEHEVDRFLASLGLVGIG